MNATAAEPTRRVRRPKWLALSEVYVPLTGGHVVWLHEVCKRLGRVRLLTGRHPGEPDRAAIDGVEVVRVGLERWPFVRPESLPLYVNFLRHAAGQIVRHRPEAILAARILPEGLLAGLLGRAFRVPSVVFAHGEEISRMRPEKSLAGRRRGTAELKRKALWAAYRRADRIIANSRSTRDLLVQGGVDARNVWVVHPGTDPERFRPMPPDPALSHRLGVNGKRVLLSLGRLVYRKGQDMTTRAMPAILRELPDTVYVIAGQGEYEPELRRLAESLRVTENVRFVGKVDDGTIPKLYNLADVFVMASRTMPGSGDLEGFGIVFLEAGACEVPVIGGRSGGVPEAVRHERTGLVVDGESPSEIAEAVLRILGDPEWARSLGRNGRQRVRRELTWDHSAEGVRAAVASLPGVAAGTPLCHNCHRARREEPM